MPNTAPSVKPTRQAANASTSVLPIALPISLATGRPVAIEVPRSPIVARPSQSAYWTGIGLSRPYSFLSWSISSIDASEGTIADSGSPGARYTSEKQTALTASAIGMTRPRRLRR